MSYNLSNLLYLITIVAFILALRFLSNPATARRGNQIGAIGMVIAIVVTWVKVGATDWWAMAIAMLIGGGFGAVAARKVKMTAMPQMVALFNGVGGGAVAIIAWIEYRHGFVPTTHPPTTLNYPLRVEIPSLFAAIIGSISRPVVSRSSSITKFSGYFSRSGHDGGAVAPTMSMQ